jgi:hypothetical protein
MCRSFLLSKRSTSDMMPFLDLQNEEVNQLIKSIRSGDASRSDLEEASSLNVLWCGVVLVLKSNIYFVGNEDVGSVAAKLPVHVQRFFGAFFSTFETVMGHQRSNSPYLVQSLLLCVQPNADSAHTVIVQMMRDYKTLFSYAYMFNRRTGVVPTSQLEQVTDYFKHLKTDAVVEGVDSSATAHMLLDDDNDSYEQLLRATTERIAAPRFSAPSVMPLRPVKLLSDDEHYGSDYQPAVASDLENDLLYNKQHVHAAQEGALLNDDSMYSMDGGSILNSYYKYNGWNNSIEEDEDSGDDHYQPPVPAPRTKRMTRMRQQAESTDTAVTGKNKKKVSKRSAQRGKPAQHGRPRALPQDVAAQSGEDSGSLPSSPEEAGGSGRAQRRATDLRSSSGSDAPYREDGSDDEVPGYRQKPARDDTGRQNSLVFGGRARADSGEVEDFEQIEEDLPRRNPAGKPAARTHAEARGGFKAEAHSPPSAGSSIELSDSDRRGGTRGTKVSTPSGTLSRRDPVKKEAAAAAGPGRMRSVLSDEDSDEGKEESSWRPTQAALSAAQRGVNPLEASIEADRTVPKVAAGRSRNPLDASVEGFLTRFSDRDEMRSDANASGKTSSSWVTAGATSAAREDPWRTSAPAKSVVRMPSASPSKPDPMRKKMDTEGAVDIVSNWDSPSDSGSGVDEPHVSTRSASARDAKGKSSQEVKDSAVASDHSDGSGPLNSRFSKGVPAGHRAAESRPSAAVASGAEQQSGDSTNHQDDRELIWQRAAARGGAGAPERNASGSAVHGGKDDRAAAIAKMKDNMARLKREKELQQAPYGSGTIVGAGVPAPSARAPPTPQLPQPRVAPSPVLPVSILRKSVTFVDQRDQSAVRSDSAIASADAAADSSPAPERAPSPISSAGPVRMHSVNMRGSVDDTVLYGSRQTSLSALVPPEQDSTPVPDTRWLPRDAADLRSQPPDAHTHTQAPLPPFSPIPIAEDTPRVREAPTPELTSAPGRDRPRVSRVPSEQLLPPRRPASSALDRNSSRPLPLSSPLTASVDSELRQFSSSSAALSSSTKPAPSLSDHFQPPPLSEFALSSGIILEGYLQKKSAGIMGQWQKVFTALC